ncbi:MAG: hypothetical protein M1831_000276 [Alyxoria varia]|nr:MAG: hypothetical protein M1831_000276 [Alyxoria varia]
MPAPKRRRGQPLPQEDPSEPSTPIGLTQTNARSPAPSDTAADIADDPPTGAATQDAQMTKNLVRLALSSEYSRLPLKRPEITHKCLNGQSRAFARTFDAAQLALRSTFGMEMVELPAKDRVTLTQRRQAAKSAGAGAGAGATQSQGGGAAASKAWVVRSVMPTRFREGIAGEVGGSRIPTAETEEAYVGLSSFVVAVVSLSGGQIPEAKLERHLKRCNAETTTPVDRTDKLILRMCKEGYLVKIKETSGGEEVTEYILGPRAKVEVGEGGVGMLVKRVWGFENESEEVQGEIGQRLERSLKVARTNMAGAGAGGENGGAKADGEPAPKRGRKKKQVVDGDGEDD